MIRFRSCALTVALTAAVASAASAADFTIDKNHTVANFSATHLAVSKVSGTIPVVSGTIGVGANNMPTGGTATFDMAGLTTGLERRDTDLKNNYLEIAKYPTMTFTIKKVDGTPQAFTMTGDLALHGVTKTVTLKGSMVGAADIRGKHQVGYTAATTIDRRDYGITFGPLLDNALVAGDDIGIEIDATAVSP